VEIVLSDCLVRSGTLFATTLVQIIRLFDHNRLHMPRYEQSTAESRAYSPHLHRAFFHAARICRVLEHMPQELF
jgi:hypothetical protein